jgi:hypothetical protein
VGGVIGGAWVVRYVLEREVGAQLLCYQVGRCCAPEVLCWYFAQANR